MQNCWMIETKALAYSWDRLPASSISRGSRISQSYGFEQLVMVGESDQIRYQKRTEPLVPSWPVMVSQGKRPAAKEATWVLTVGSGILRSAMRCLAPESWAIEGLVRPLTS